MAGRTLARGLAQLRLAAPRMVALLYLILFLTSRSHAQVAEAAVGGEEQFAAGGMVSSFHIDYGKRWLGGAGVYVDANLNPHLGLEGEACWLFTNQDADTHLTTYLGGPRYTFKARGRLRPYAKMLAGVGEFSFPYHYANGSYLVLAPGGGLDYRVTHHIRIRLLDVEYQRWPLFSFGPLSTYGASVGIRYSFR